MTELSYLPTVTKQGTMITFYNLALLSSILISQPPAMVNQEINIMSLELYNEIFVQFPAYDK